MIITRYGIKLIRLRRDQIEIVRKWRNAPRISNFMEYREHITPEMQEKWFDSLDELADFYFVIEYHDELVGLIHTSSIEWDNSLGHAGLFVWDDKLLSTHIPVLASLSMVDFFFSFCTLKKIYAKVMKNNKVAIKYNGNLGFVLSEGQEGKEFQEYILEREYYFATTSNLHESATKVGQNSLHIEMEQRLYDELKKADAINSDSCKEQEKVLLLT